MDISITEIRDQNKYFSKVQKEKIRICMLRIGEVIIKCYANELIIQEYEKYMKTNDSSMLNIKNYINEFEETYFAYTLTYLAKNLFKEIMVEYSLLGLKNIISDMEYKCMDLNYNFLIEQSKLLEEKTIQFNHSSDSIFSGFYNYKYDEKIAEIIELSIKNENIDVKLHKLYEEFMKLDA